MQWLRLAPVLLVAVVTACQSTAPAVPVKSPNDHREYRYVVLPNNLQGILIHAPGGDRAAAAASVARGSDHDPGAHPGLAHFVEHMLFIATGKYPEVDGFAEFIQRHGGSRNAYTANDHTTYHFDIKPERLPEALDRFAQFFIAPSFDPDYVEREVEREKEAVQGEYQVQFKQDSWRGPAVHKRLMSAEYPGSRFNIGSLETLRDVGAAEARAFFEANYSADTMTFAVLGPQDLDTLENLVSEHFGAVVDRGLGPRPANPHLYDPGSLPASYAWQTVKESRRLTFRFPVPPLRPHYRIKPTYHLASVIGHEGPGSLHEFLSERGWIESLNAWGYSYDTENSIFSVAVSLTEEGNSHVDEIVDLTYAWIDLIRRQGLAGWRYDENARWLELGFRFKEESSPTNAVISAAEGLADYPPVDILRAPYLMERFDEALIRRYLDEITPDNSLISLAGPDVEGDRTEPVFGVPWRAAPVLLPREVEAPLALPEANPYLPEDLELAFEPLPPGKPVLLDADTAVETWHAPDTEFRTPTARVDLTLRMTQPFGPDDVVLATIYAELVGDAMNARAYAARLAGLAYAVNPTWTGFSIAVSGYDDKLAVLFDDMLAAFVNTTIDAAKFAVAREEFAKSYTNLARERPYQQVSSRLRHLVHSWVWPDEALTAAVHRVTPEALEAWRKTRLRGMGATLFVHGNQRSADARSLATLVHRRLMITEMPHELPVARHIDASRTFEHAIDHDDAAFLLYVQGESDAVEERARVGLIGHMLGSRYFTALRTERQLGYVVQAYSTAIARRAALVCVVQASKAGVAEIEALTRSFLDEQRAWLRGLSADELGEHKSGYIAALTRADRNNYQRASRLLGDLAARVLTFDDRQQLADAVARLQPADVADAYDALVDPGRGSRLTVFSRGKPGTAPGDGEPIASIDEFKRHPGAR